MAALRAFISFEMEDRWARDFLIEQTRNRRNDIEFVDYSVHEPLDEMWKMNCRQRIARTKGTIVLIGETSWKSEAVLWEIAETERQDHYMFAIQINSGKLIVSRMAYIRPGQPLGLRRDRARAEQVGIGGLL
jgi:hypothetical protein